MEFYGLVFEISSGYLRNSLKIMEILFASYWDNNSTSDLRIRISSKIIPMGPLPDSTCSQGFYEAPQSARGAQEG